MGFKMKRRLLTSACISLSAFAFLSWNGLGEAVSIETDPKGCYLKVYKWVPFADPKGTLLVEGKSPLDIPDEVLKNIRMVVVEGSKEGYLSREIIFTTPFRPSTMVQLPEDENYQRKIRAEMEKKVSEERKKEEAAKQQEDLRAKQKQTEITRPKILPNEGFKILNPRWGFYQNNLSKLWYPTIDLAIKNIGSSEIRELYLKARFLNRNNKVVLGENSVVFKNIPPGYSSMRMSIICPADAGMCIIANGGGGFSAAGIEIGLFWADDQTGNWIELPDFSNSLWANP